ncbi:MAG TPA: ImuA protein [Xanthobacteraceae bacterium]|nr:ImuA protein [Xanthobacteraceae bacterium]
MSESAALSAARNRAAIMEELRRLMPGAEGLRTALSLGLTAIDSHLPQGGLTRGALHEIVPDGERAIAAAFGFIAALLARLPQVQRLVFVMPAYGQRHYGRLSGHGLNALGLDPGRVILVETGHRTHTLWAMEEALRSGAPAAVAGIIDKLDLKLSQRLHLAATDCGLPLLLIRPARDLESSAAATRWRIGTAEAARDRFGLITHPRWHLHLERVRNGRPGEWVVEYDHVAHRFSLAAAMANPAHARGASQKAGRQAHCA